MEIKERKLCQIGVQGWPLVRDLAVASHREKRVSKCLRQFLDIAARQLIGRKQWKTAASK